jgi:aspartyl-tRNA synthetase
MERTYIKEIINKIGKRILIKGWVTAVRQHGGVNFIDVRDWTGVAQAVLRDQQPTTNEQRLNEWTVVEIIGEVVERPENMVNPDLATGKVEVKSEKLEIINSSRPAPIPLTGEGYEISEKARLKYRYLDLRRPRLQKNLKIRQELKQKITDFLTKSDFVEITTPILTKSTPEGARDFVVPSRLHPGKFYALPQSPQQYKQLLMVAGIEKYFQFPLVFRDEDLRADRLLEHTQLDIEMAFITREKILSLIEELVIYATAKILGKKIRQTPFPQITYQEAMEKYQTDKPDLRTSQEKKQPALMAYAWITDFPMFEQKEDGSLGAVHHPFTKIQDPRYKDTKRLIEFLGKSKNNKQELLKLKAYQYDLVLNGAEVAGGSIREHRSKVLQAVFEALGHSSQEVQEKFGHLLEAFKYGVPPHGGIAFGFDRWLATLLNEPSIREVVAFPSSGSGQTAVMEAPSQISKEQLKELHIKIKS